MTTAGAKIREELTIDEFSGVCPVGNDTRKMAEIASRLPRGDVLDMGTGTGFIAISLARLGFRVDAVDSDPRAVENSIHNVQKNGVTVRVSTSRLFEKVNDRYDTILFNPPRHPGAGSLERIIAGFIRKRKWITRLLLPIASFFHGNERLDFIHSFVREAQEHLKTGGRILIHVTSDEAEKIRCAFAGKIRVTLEETLPPPDGQIISIS